MSTARWWWAWVLGLAAALLATTASAELWIPSIFSGSGKTAPVHQPHGSAHPTRAAAAGERDDTRGSAHKLRGNFGTGIVVPADDAEVPKTPDPVDVPKIDVPVDDAKKTTEADYDIENVELPPVESTPTTNENHDGAAERCGHSTSRRGRHPARRNIHEHDARTRIDALHVGHRRRPRRPPERFRRHPARPRGRHLRPDPPSPPSTQPRRGTR